MKLNVGAFAITCALVWGLGVFALGWWVILFGGHAGEVVPLLGLMYRGFTFSPVGTFIGLIWALPDGFILGALVAGLYNAFSGNKRAVV